MSDRCKNCGYCPHCGRSNTPYTIPWTYPIYPYYQQPYVYGAGTSPKVTNGSVSLNQAGSVSGSIQSAARTTAEHCGHAS